MTKIEQNPHTASGIYFILCLPTARIYVGSSVDILTRLAKHKRALRGGYHENPILQRAFNKYSEQAFAFGILTITANSNLLTEEQNFLTAVLKQKTFNIAPIAQKPPSPLGKRPSLAARQKMSKAAKHRSLEHRAKLAASISGAKNHNYGKPSWNHGKPSSIETRKKQSLAKIGNQNARART